MAEEQIGRHPEAVATLRLPGVMAAVIGFSLGALLLARLTCTTADLDLFHLMALARESFRLGYIPTVDHFAYTPTIGLSIQHEWGAGFIAYFLATCFGGPGIVTLKILLADALGTACVLCANARGATLALAALAGVPAILLAGNGFSPVRSQMYSFVFAAALLGCLRADERGSRRWILPWLAMFPLWVNLHAGFVVGLGFFGLHWIEQVLRRKPHKHVFFVLLAMCGLIVVNPYGVNYYVYVWNAIQLSRPDIVEWGPVWKSVPAFYTAVFAAATLLICYACTQLKARQLPGLGIVAVTIAAAAMHGRMLPFFAIAFFCYAPFYLGQTRLGAMIGNGLARPSPAAIGLWGTIGVVFLLLAVNLKFWELRVPGQPTTNTPDWAILPVGPVEYLQRTGFEGNVMTPFEQGSYVSWKLYPHVRVSVDSRYECAYQDWLVRQMFRFYAAQPGWRDTLAEYATDLVLIRRDQPLSRAMGEVHWRRIYVDRGFEMYARPGLFLPVSDWSARTFEGVFP
jgi:hypothetical protein